MPEKTEIVATKLPPGPESASLRFDRYQFDSGFTGPREPRFGLDPERLPSRLVVADSPWSVASPRILRAQAEGQAWARGATVSALARLPERYRNAMVMFYWGGESHTSIAERLGITENNLWVLLYRARKMLVRLSAGGGQ